MSDVDAVVIGSGPNGLVAANLLADKGWTVAVLEAQPEPGGAVRSAEVTEPGFTSDLYSAFYPLAAVSPVLGGLGLESHGLEWLRAPVVVAHPSEDGRCATMALDLEESIASMEAFAPGDGERWRDLCAEWEAYEPGIVGALMTPFPPTRAAARLALTARRDLLRFARMSMLPVRRFAEERFRGEGAGWMLAGNALHADLTPDSAGGGLYGWVLCGLGQRVGFPFPKGGAGKLTKALVGRLTSAGGSVRCDSHVDRVLTRGQRAVGVRLDDGTEVSARHAVIATVGAPALYEQMLDPDLVPARVTEDLQNFQYDNSTVKVDWALDGPIPWSSPDARRAGTVHVAEGMDALTETTSQLVRRQIPSQPFLVVGQYSMADGTRAPEGKEAAWAYTHVPQHPVADAGGEMKGTWDEAETAAFVGRMEGEMERLAPGFRKLIRARHVMTPLTLEESNENLVRGAINGGTAQIHQQLVFRPRPGLARPETPVDGLYLGSASAHPGGGVHGAPGANAAKAALGRVRRPKSVLIGTAVSAVAGAGIGAARLKGRRAG